MNLSMPQLGIGRYRLRFDGPPQPGEFAGNHWRGAFGHALRARACTTGASNCDGCPQAPHCRYAYLFDTPVPADSARMRLYTQAPHPYVLRETSITAPTNQSCGALEFSLFGRANEHVALVHAALVDAASASTGIGHRHPHMHAIEHESAAGSDRWLPLGQPSAGSLAKYGVEPAAWPALAPASIRIELQTPLRIKREGRPLSPRTLRFSDFFGSLLRRISMLTYFHTDTPLETDFRHLMDAAWQVEMTAELRWQEQARYSSRQQAQMQMDGLLGTIDVIPTPLIELFWPYLWLGQFAHVGSATTMGMGAYRIVTGAASLPQAA